MKKVLSYFRTKDMQKLFIVFSIFVMFAIIFAVKPFATDGYEDICDRKTLDKRVATAIENGQTELCIDYSGEDYTNMKSWFKEDFKYDNLIKYIDEFSIYNYNGAKYSYWSYGDKKRVKVTISYKLNSEQIATVNSFVNNYINSNGLREKSQYDAIKYIHDYLVNNYVYTSNVNNIYDMINSGKANCYGYTMLNYVFLNELGIPVRTTYGAMNDSHIWNAVQLNGQWYYEDVTWDTVDKGTSYFLVSTEQIKKTHKIYGNFIPNCPNTYVEVSAKPDENEKIESTETITENKDISVKEKEDYIIQETTEVEEKITDVETKENVGEVKENTENTELSTEKNNTELQKDDSNKVEKTENETITEESAPSNEDNNSNTDNSSKSSISTKEKIQKLVKLLKQLLMLKRTK